MDLSLPEGEKSNSGEVAKQEGASMNANPPTCNHNSYKVINEPSNCIQVANLKMPYTIIDLRELMETFGKFERCWTNRTQSHCMVEFKQQDSAKRAVEELYLKQWPPENGGKLITDYIDIKRMNDLISKKSVPIDLEDKVNELNGTIGSKQKEKPSTSTAQIEPIRSLKIKKASEKTGENGMGDEIPLSKYQSGTSAPGQTDRRIENQHHLDKFFKKTQAKPHIYYKILSKEEATMLRKRSQKDKVKE